MYEIGFEEYLYGNGVCVIEWGSIVEEILPKDAINIKIKNLGEFSREIEIKSDRITLK